MNSPEVNPSTPNPKSAANKTAVGQEPAQAKLAELLRVIGRKLKDKREALGWTPELAAKKTKIKLPQVLALEYGKVEAFSTPSHARGFASIYLRTLEFDDKEELTAFDRALNVRPTQRIEGVKQIESRPEPIPVETREAPSTLGFKVVIACTVLVTLVICLVGFQSYKAGIIRVPLADGIRSETGNLNLSEQKNADEALLNLQDAGKAPVAVAVPPEETAAKAQPVALPAQAAPATAVPVAAAAPVAQPATPVATLTEAPADGTYDIVLAANRRSFISVVTHNADGGKTRFAGVLKPGDRKAFKGRKMDIMIAIPAAINIEYNGVDQGPYSYSVVPASFSIPAP